MKLLDPLYKRKAFRISGSNSRLYLIMRSKFLLSFFLLIVVPFLVFGIITHIKNVYMLLDQNNKQILTDLNDYLSNIESFVNLTSKNETLLNLFEEITNSSNIQTEQFRSKAAAIFADTSEDIKNVKFNGIYILRNSKVYTIYCKYDNPIPQNGVFSKKWYQEALSNPEKVKIIGTSMQFFSGGKSEYIFSAAKALKNPQSGENTGLLLVDFDYGVFDKIIKTADSLQYSGHEVYIINQDNSNIVDSPPGNTIMYSNTANLLTSPIDSEILKAIGEPVSGTYLGNIEGRGNLLAAFTTSEKVPWKIIYIFPAYKVLFELSPYKYFWLVILLVCLVMILIFPYVIYRVILKPISRLTSVITEYEKGSFPTKLNLDSPGNEENSQINTGSPSNIDNLINKVYYNQLKQKEAELNSLQNKINPHFLYNTLESIRGAALYHGIDSIASMAKSLSLLFRYSINNNVLVTVKEEIENLVNYITIQNFRHDDKFEVIYNIPENVYQYKILKLILQPIVENSIKHGLEMKLCKGLIKVTFLDLGSILKIEISDDGIGISPERIAELNKLLTDGNSGNLNENDSSSGTGIGMLNVNSRIKLYFGEQYGIKFLEVQTGTTVEIMLPVVE